MTGLKGGGVSGKGRVCIMSRAGNYREPTSQRRVKIQFWLVGFMLSLAILAGKNCRALECWTENKDENYLIITKVNQENKTYGRPLFALHAYSYGFSMLRSV